MRPTSIILILLLFGCTERHKSEQRKTVKSVPTVTKENSYPYDTVLTKEHQYKNLSHQFDIKLFFKRFKNVDEFHDSCIVKLVLTYKRSESVFDTLEINSNSYSSDFFQDPKNVLSYSTNINSDRQISDNYFGDIIVADLNFDNKDDIAIINDSGGNGGSFYSYFLQNSEKNFTLDSFLTDSMTYFPLKINNRNRTLVTFVHAGACCVGEHVYLFSKSNRKWTEKSHRILRL